VQYADFNDTNLITKSVSCLQGPIQLAFWIKVILNWKS